MAPASLMSTSGQVVVQFFACSVTVVKPGSDNLIRFCAAPGSPIEGRPQINRKLLTNLHF